MEQFIHNVLEAEPLIVFFVIMMLAFVPGSSVVLIKKLNRWVKTIVVLFFGELGAISLWVLARAAKVANAGNILAEFTPFAIIFAILFLGCAIVGHVFNWDRRVVSGLKKENNEK